MAGCSKTEKVKTIRRFKLISLPSQKKIQNYIDVKLLPKLGDLYFTDLNSNRIYQFYLELKKSNLSNSTIKRHHSGYVILGDFYEEIDSEFVNPFRGLKKFSKLFPRQGSTREIDFLTEDELSRVFAELKSVRSRVVESFLCFLAYTGLRRSEALALRWVDIDWSGGFIEVRQSKNGKARRVPLEKPAAKALSLIKDRTGKIFKNPETNEPYTQDAFLKPLKAAAKRAGIQKRVDLHMLRHSFGSNKIRRGWGLKKVSMILGHSDVQITSSIYTHLLDGDLKVRDEFCFDKANEASQSSEVNLNSPSMLQIIEQLPAEILNNPDAYQVARTALIDEVDALLRAHRVRGSAKSVETCGSLQNLSNSALAPHMLRGHNNDVNVESETLNSGSFHSVVGSGV